MAQARGPIRRGPSAGRLRTPTAVAVLAALLATLLTTGASPRSALAEEPGGPDKALIDAVRSGDLARVRSALNAEADPNARDARRWTPLTYAAMGGYVDIAETLIRAGAEIDARSNDGSTPLMVAAVMGHETLARRLLQRGADPTLRNSAGADARLKAEQYGHTRLARTLTSAATTTSDLPRDPQGARSDAASSAAPEASSPEPPIPEGPVPEALIPETPRAEAPSSGTPSSSEATPVPAPRADRSAEAAAPSLPTPRPPEAVRAEPAPPIPGGPSRPSPAESPTVAESEDLEPIDRDYVAKKDAILRSGPIQKSERIGAVPAGTRMRVVGKVVGRDWFRVIHEGEVAYVYDRLLRPTRSSETSQTSEREEVLPSGAGDAARAGARAAGPRTEGQGSNDNDGDGGSEADRGTSLREDDWPAPLEEPLPADRLANGRYATLGNPRGCTSDYLEVRLVGDRLTLTVKAANEITVVAEDLPVLSISGPRLIAGSPDLAWELFFTRDELRYQVGEGSPVLYERCSSIP